MRAIKLLSLVSLLAINLVSCSQEKQNAENAGIKESPIHEKMATLEMNKDSMDMRIFQSVQDEVMQQKSELTENALQVIQQTQLLLQDVSDKKKEDAVKKGKALIGDIEVLLSKDPGLAFIPVNVVAQKEEFVTDIETVRKITKSAKEAMDNGYYRLASDLIKDLRSEMVINTYLIPTETYPEAIKQAVVLTENDKFEEAEIVLISVLNTVVIEKVVVPLPILYAEQMIAEAAKIDTKNHDNADKVINLLKNAEYQLQLAEELGYGKKDKDYALLNEAVSALKESVNNKENSTSKFDSIKKDISDFKNRLFPTKAKK